MPALAIPVDLMEYLRKKDEDMKPYLNSDVLVSCLEWFLQRDDGFYADHAQRIKEMLARKSREIELRTGQPSGAKKSGKRRTKKGLLSKESIAEIKRAREAALRAARERERAEKAGKRRGEEAERERERSLA